MLKNPLGTYAYSTLKCSKVHTHRLYILTKGRQNLVDPVDIFFFFSNSFPPSPHLQAIQKHDPRMHLSATLSNGQKNNTSSHRLFLPASLALSQTPTFWNYTPFKIIHMSPPPQPLLFLDLMYKHKPNATCDMRFKFTL